MGDHKKHPMRVVTGRTGLSPHVVRVWEKRYQAISPDRSKTNRRFYSEEDIERLNLLKKLTSHRYRIGKVANLPLEELRKTAEKVLEAKAGEAGETAGESSRISENIRAPFHGCLLAVEQLDPISFRNQLMKVKLQLSPLNFLEEFVGPLLSRLSEEVRGGDLRVYHYQMAWELIDFQVRELIKSFNNHDGGPMALIAAPSGHRDEFSPLSAMAATSAMGWRNLYLGVNLTVEDIAEATQLSEADLLILAMSFSRKDPLLIQSLTRLRSLLPVGIPVLIVGGDYTEYAKELKQIEMENFLQFSQVQSFLEVLSKNLSTILESAE